MRNHFLILEKEEEEYILRPVEKIIRVERMYQNETKISLLQEMNNKSTESYLNLNIN